MGEELRIVSGQSCIEEEVVVRFPWEGISTLRSDITCTATVVLLLSPCYLYYIPFLVIV